MQRKRIINSICCTILTSFLFFGAVSNAGATMSNDNYIIQMGNFNMSSGKMEDDKHKVGNTVGQTSPGLFSNNKVQVKSGFWYLYPMPSFTFSLSDSLIDFGILSATNPVTRTTTLSVTNPPPSGYRVLAYENHPLLTNTNIAIPDTSCDNGACTEIQGSIWESELTYGFGYRCDSVKELDCAEGFTDPDSYKQFPDGAKKESPVSIMRGNKRYSSPQSNITYKVNVSGTQRPGTYTNTITYIAVPGF